MKTFSNYISERLIINKDFSEYKVEPKLDELIESIINFKESTIIGSIIDRYENISFFLDSICTMMEAKVPKSDVENITRTIVELIKTNQCNRFLCGKYIANHHKQVYSWSAAELLGNIKDLNKNLIYKKNKINAYYTLGRKKSVIVIVIGNVSLVYIYKNDLVDERLIKYPKQVSEKLIINKDYNLNINNVDKIIEKISKEEGGEVDYTDAARKNYFNDILSHFGIYTKTTIKQSLKPDIIQEMIDVLKGKHVKVYFFGEYWKQYNVCAHSCKEIWDELKDFYDDTIYDDNDGHEIFTINGKDVSIISINYKNEYICLLVGKNKED